MTGEGVTGGQRGTEGGGGVDMFIIVTLTLEMLITSTSVFTLFICPLKKKI